MKKKNNCLSFAEIYYCSTDLIKDVVFSKKCQYIFAIVSILFKNCLAFWLAAHSWVNQSEVSSIQKLGKIWFDVW